MQDEVALGLMRILVEMVDALGVKRGSAAFQAVNFITFREEEFRQVRSVLSGDPGDQRAFWQTSTSWNEVKTRRATSAGGAGSIMCISGFPIVSTGGMQGMFFHGVLVSFHHTGDEPSSIEYTIWLSPRSGKSGLH
jgi:hypothetical protein